MEDWIILLIIFGAIALIGFISWIIDLKNKAKKYKEFKPKIDSLDTYKKELELRDIELKKEENDTRQIIKEKAMGFPSLVKAYNDYFDLHDSKSSYNLMYKAHPARKAAEELRQIAKERREAEKAARQANYLLDYLNTHSFATIY